MRCSYITEKDFTPKDVLHSIISSEARVYVTKDITYKYLYEENKQNRDKVLKLIDNNPIIYTPKIIELIYNPYTNEFAGYSMTTVEGVNVGKYVTNNMQINDSFDYRCRAALCLINILRDIETKGFIHTDLHMGNMIINRDKAYIIDIDSMSNINEGIFTDSYVEDFDYEATSYMEVKIIQAISHILLNYKNPLLKCYDLKDEFKNDEIINALINYDSIYNRSIQELIKNGYRVEDIFNHIDEELEIKFNYLVKKR